MSLCKRHSGKAGLGCSKRLVDVRTSLVCGKVPLQVSYERKVKAGVGWGGAGCVAWFKRLYGWGSPLSH